MKHKKSVTFIVTALNEEKNIIECLSELNIFLNIHFEEYKIFFIDDGSTDNTLSNAKNLELTHLTIFKNDLNIGAGGSIKKVLSLITTDFFCWFPSDREFHPSIFTKALNCLEKNDVIITYTDNSRIVRTKFRYYLSSIFTTILNFVFNEKIKYYNGTTFYKTSMFNQFIIYSNRFFFHAELLLKALATNPRFAQVNVSLSSRTHGKSSAIKIKNLADVINCFFNCLWEVKIKKKIHKDSYTS